MKEVGTNDAPSHYNLNEALAWAAGYNQAVEDMWKEVTDATSTA